jgi:hypothetical protein
MNKNRYQVTQDPTETDSDFIKRIKSLESSGRAGGRAGGQAGGRAGTDAGGTMLLTEGFLGWLSRFKQLIRLRRISLATLPRYGRRG